MSRSAFPAALLLILAAGWSPALVRSADAWQDTRLTQAMATMPASTARDLERAIADAQALGLPISPLVDKALEGSAKGVAADQVLLVVRDLVGQLGRARDLVALEGTAPSTDIVAVAEALRRGVPEDAVRSLRSKAPGQSIALSVHTLADLLDRGVPVDHALDVLGAWNARGARPEELRSLPVAVERLIRGGILPAEAAAAVASSVRGGKGIPTDGPPGLTPPGQGKGRKDTGGKGKRKGPPKGRPNGLMSPLPLPPSASPGIG